MSEQSNTYPTKEAVLKFVKPSKDLGKDQAARVDHVQKAIAALKRKKQKPTAEAVAAVIPEGRRTLRRAVRAGALEW